MSALHVYTRPHQPATRFVTTLNIPVPGGWKDERHWTRYKPGRLLPTSCCYKRRPAKNLTVQVFYDHVPFWCRPGTGCKIPKRVIRVTTRVLLREFQSGKTFLALARKYKTTRRKIEERIREGFHRFHRTEE
jgi:hypothetical protein